MYPKSQKSRQPELFREKLEDMIDKTHELVLLSKLIDWERFDKRFGENFSPEQGRPGIPTRLMVGVQYLKYLNNLSDDLVVKFWRENPYWQYFCGCEYFEKRFPFDRSSMSRWRKKLGKGGVEELFKETLSVAYRSGGIELQELTTLLADTTVQEKNITFPTDVKLYHRARELIVKVVKSSGLKLRQTYVKLSKHWLLKANRYSAAKQLKRARKSCRKVHNFLGRVLREVERKISDSTSLKALFEEVLKTGWQIYHMKARGEKIYSLHEPHVECIAKGKAHKRYEFGVKVSVLTSAQSGYIIGCSAFHGRPHDGKTLKPALRDAALMVGSELKDSVISVDRGYKGHGLRRGKVIHPNLKRLSPEQRRIVKKRSAIEATISCMKRCYRLGKNYLSGINGDHINPKLAAAAFNLAKVMRQLKQPQYT